jgi:hypothetical protein
LDQGSLEMQFEHAGILDLVRLKFTIIKLVFKCKFAQGVSYGVRLCGLGSFSNFVTGYR